MILVITVRYYSFTDCHIAWLLLSILGQGASCSPLFPPAILISMLSQILSHIEEKSAVPLSPLDLMEGMMIEFGGHSPHDTKSTSMSIMPPSNVANHSGTSSFHNLKPHGPSESRCNSMHRNWDDTTMSKNAMIFYHLDCLRMIDY